MKVYYVNRTNSINSLKPKLKNKILFLVSSIFFIIISIILVLSTIFLVVFLKPKKISENESNLNRNKTRCKFGFFGDECDECGLVFKKPNLRIVGGKEAVPYSWPSSVFIKFDYKSYTKLPDTNKTVLVEKSYTCGGTLISRKSVLTAAHCIIDKIEFNYENKIYYLNPEPNDYYSSYESMYKIYLGIHNNRRIYQNLSLIYPEVEMKVNQIIKHQNYNKLTKLNDIAIIKLKYSAVLNEFIQIACLPDPTIANYPSKVNIETWVSGWGVLKYGGITPYDLYNVKLTLYDKEKCINVFNGVEKNWDLQLCAGDLLGNKDTCQGDSGGALFVEDIVNNATKFIAVGIVSYGDGCAKPNLPGIYTKISYYLDWIYFNA